MIGMQKVIILRRPPRFDPVSCDPLELKPQLSRLGDSVMFDLWCESKFKKRIHLGDHTIPHLLDGDHNRIFGNPGQGMYDGVHMLGPDGRNAYQRSILNILLSAGLLKPPAKPQKIPPVDKRAQRLEPASLRYDPLKILRERLSSMRDNSSSQPTVISSPPILKQSKMSSTNAPRKSVITTVNKESNYSVPVSNSFEILGN